jgi:amino acid transporter
MAKTPVLGETDSPRTEKFGTFLGVYTPSLLTILGLIMYLRFGWVLGNLGLALTVLTVLLASSITFITALSASAVATNMQVGAGGEYYMISRSFGLELGGAIGIPLFLSRTLSITFYSFGLAESIVALWSAVAGNLPSHAAELITALVIIVITLLSGRSASLALRLQVPVILAIGLSLVALVAGIYSGGLRAPEWAPRYRTAPEGFWYVFAVFFPAVTGFAAGIAMSGDLKDPRRSIPRGILLAVLTGTLVYLLVPILFASTSRVSLEQLSEPGVASWTSVALLGPWLVYPGLWGAVLSSAIGSVLGGPRVLQALASDGLAPKFLARLSPTGQPTVATWICGAIALAAVLLGGVNAVAQFVTVLFLTLYITINLAAGVEKLVGDPSYRPTINVPWYVSFLGAVGAAVVMFLINPLVCIGAIAFEICLYVYLRRRAMQRSWGDVRAGFWVALARFSLLKLREQGSHPRNWRPQILLFVGDPAKRISLVRMASWFNQNRGVVTACKLIKGDLKEEDPDIEEIRAEMGRALEQEGLTAFCEADVVRELESGAIDVAQANGFAGLQSNTVMFGWSRRRERLASMLRIMRAVSRAGKSTVIARIDWAHEPGQKKKIDLWWGGLQNNGDMMLLFAYLLRLNPEWNDARIVVRSIVDSEEERDQMAESLEALMQNVRIEADAQIIVRRAGQIVPDILKTHSGSADVVLLGLMDPDPGTEEEYADRLAELASGLHTTIFIRNAGRFAGRLV